MHNGKLPEFIDFTKESEALPVWVGKSGCILAKINDGELWLASDNNREVIWSAENRIEVVDWLLNTKRITKSEFEIAKG